MSAAVGWWDLGLGAPRSCHVSPQRGASRSHGLTTLARLYSSFPMERQSQRGLKMSEVTQGVTLEPGWGLGDTDSKAKATSPIVHCAVWDQGLGTGLPSNVAPGDKPNQNTEGATGPGGHHVCRSARGLTCPPPSQPPGTPVRWHCHYFPWQMSKLRLRVWKDEPEVPTRHRAELGLSPGPSGARACKPPCPVTSGRGKGTGRQGEKCSPRCLGSFGNLTLRRT